MTVPHIPVLLEEVIGIFEDLPEGTVIDCTLGYGGHSEAILKANPRISLVGIDQDEEAIAFSSKRLGAFGKRARIVRGRCSEKIKEFLHPGLVGVLADIGVSSLQLDKKERGFSFESETLDMRMDKSRHFSAYDVVNGYSQEDLASIFRAYGEVKEYKKAARLIVEARQNAPIASAKELADLIARHFPKKGRIHPATAIFQAIRIEVNDELGELKRILDALEAARPRGARVAIICFHSLEDRIVKNRFNEWSKSCICPPGVFRCTCGNKNELGFVLTKKPIVAKEEEVQRNPRSRSAKMRVFEFKGS